MPKTEKVRIGLQRPQIYSMQVVYLFLWFVISIIFWLDAYKRFPQFLAMTLTGVVFYVGMQLMKIDPQIRKRRRLKTVKIMGVRDNYNMVEFHALVDWKGPPGHHVGGLADEVREKDPGLVRFRIRTNKSFGESWFSYSRCQIQCEYYEECSQNCIGRHEDPDQHYCHDHWHWILHGKVGEWYDV